ADGVEVVILFDLSGREPGQWTVVVRDGTCRVMHGRTMEPSVTLTMDSDLWLAIARGEKSGRDAFINGGYQVSGDVMFMMRFGKIFPVRGSDRRSSAVPARGVLPHRDPSRSPADAFAVSCPS